MARQLNPAQLRLQNMKGVRRAQANSLKGISAPSLSSVRENFRDCTDFLEKNLDPVGIRGETNNPEILLTKIRLAVTSLIKFAGINEEVVRTVEPRSLWNSHLDPMYNSWRTFISESRADLSLDALNNFWQLVATELHSQLLLLTEQAGVKAGRIGQPWQIAQHELSKNK